jgi:hypothetical protein
VLWLLVIANAVPSSPIPVILKMEAICSSETSVLAKATRCKSAEDGIRHSHRCENLKSYILLCLECSVRIVVLLLIRIPLLIVMIIPTIVFKKCMLQGFSKMIPPSRHQQQSPNPLFSKENYWGGGVLILMWTNTWDYYVEHLSILKHW